jgi:hypothetical protein
VSPLHSVTSWARRLATRVRPSRKFSRDASVALGVMLLVELLATALQATPGWERKTRSERDSFMRAYTGEVIRPDRARPLAFIDIDDAAFRAWGGSLITDRNRLLQLIKYAVQSGAAAVMVDVDLTPGPNQGDEAMRAWLAGYAADGRSVPPLIFLRSFAGPPDPLVTRTPRPSLADVARAGAPVLFASVAFLRDDDQVVRRWRLWEPVCRNGIPAGVPSVELLTLAIMDDPAQGAAKLDAALGKAVDGTCEALKPGMQHRLSFASHEAVELYPDAFGERILFTLPWPASALPGATIELDKRRVPLLVHLPALSIVDHDAAPDPVRGRIVVISGSNAESRDSYLTPIGAMPGGMVLLNAINSLLQQGQLHQLSAPLGIGVGVAMGMVVWLLLYVFHFAIAVALTGAVIFPLVSLLASRWIAAGVWLDLGVPTFAMFVHRWFDVLETLWRDWRCHGWRALMTPALRGEEAAGAPERQRPHAVIALALAVGASCLATTAEAQGVVAGYVSAIGGVSSECLILRGGEQMPARYWAEVRDGDVMIVLGQGFIEITQDDAAHPRRVTHQNSPMRITAGTHRGVLLQVLDEISEGIKQALTEWSDSEVVEAKIQEAGASVALALPLLAQPVDHRVVAGTRRFSLAWVGGRPPFRVLLAGPGGTNVLDMQAGEERLVSSPMRLGEGAYEARVTDAAGQTVIGAFAATSIRPAVDEHGLAGLPPGIARPLAAARLSDAAQGAWRLEAYERLAEAGRDNRAARMMADRLAHGLPLSELTPP